MKRLLVYLKEYKKECVLAPAFKLLEALFELFVPLVMAEIIDKGIVDRDMNYVLKMGGILLLLAAIGMAVAITAQFFAAKAAVGFAAKLRENVFAHIQSLDFTSVDRVGTSTLITRMTSDINQVQNGVNMTLRLFLRSPIVVFGAMIMAFTIDVKCALVFVVTIPILAVIVFGIMIKTMPMYRTVQNRLDKVLGRTRENLTGVRVIRAFNREQDQIELFEGENRALTDMQTLVGRISGVTGPVTGLVVNAAIVFLIYIGAIRVNIGSLSQGQVVAIINYMNQILVELVKLANLIILITRALACADRISNVLEIQQETVENPDYCEKKADWKEEDYLVFEHVSLTYAGAGEASLSDIDFVVKRGQTVGIIGGTGSGKSSLVNLIPAFYSATKGNIYLEGQNLRAIDPEHLGSLVGVVPQKAELFAGTVRSNLCWGLADATDEQLWEALRLAQAKEIVEGKDGMLDAEIAQKGRNLSGGQRQRLTIARALVRRPEILILDDSASALDYATEAALRKSLTELGEGTTKFIVSQRASSIRHADLILVLEEGALAGAGTHDELLAGCDVYREIYYSQYPEEAPAGFKLGFEEGGALNG